MKLHLWTPLEFYLEKSNEHKGATISLVLYHGLQQNVMSFFFCLILISLTSATSLSVLFHLYVVMMTRFEWSWIKLIKLILNKWDAPLVYIAFNILLLKANFKLLTLRLHTEADESLWGIDVVAWKSFEYSGGCACLYRVGFLFSSLLILWDCFSMCNWSWSNIGISSWLCSSFNDKPVNEGVVGPIGKELFEKEQDDLLSDLVDIPKKACDRRVRL